MSSDDKLYGETHIRIYAKKSRSQTTNEAKRTTADYTSSCEVRCITRLYPAVRLCNHRFCFLSTACIAGKRKSRRIIRPHSSNILNQEITILARNFHPKTHSWSRITWTPTKTHSYRFIHSYKQSPWAVKWLNFLNIAMDSTFFHHAEFKILSTVHEIFQNVNKWKYIHTA